MVLAAQTFRVARRGQHVGPAIDKIDGTFDARCKGRLDITFPYEHAQVCALRRIADKVKATRFLDIGANIGVYAVYIGDLPALQRVDASEPAPDTFLLLEQNQAMQKREGLFVHRIALSDHDGIVEFAIYGDIAGNNAVLETSVHGRAPDRVERVDCRRLDQISDTRGETFVCKIDVEGHEVAVIKGGGEFLKGNRGVLQIECFPRQRQQLRALMEEIGYRYVFRAQSDLYFTNLEDPARVAEIQEILFSEVATALDELKQMKMNRRKLYREIRTALDTAGITTDPLMAPRESTTES